MLKLDKINKKFKSKNNSVQALSDVSYIFPEAGLISIVGKSGSGKTTLLNILAGLSSPSSGDYYIENLNSKNLSKKDWDLLRKEYFSFIFQDKNLIEKRTVFENLQLVLLGKCDINEEIDKVLSLFDIGSLKNTTVADLSGGEKQRVAIARAYLKQSKVILADEPSASLDEANTTIVFETLKKASKEKLVILVTHDVEFANKYSDSIINISYGKISIDEEAKQEETLDTISLNNRDKDSLKDLLFKRKMLFGKQKFTKIFSCILLSLVSSLLCLSGYYTLFDKDEYEARISRSNALNSFIIDGRYSELHQINNIDFIKQEKYPSVTFNECYTVDSIAEYNLLLDYVDSYSLIDGALFGTAIIDSKIGKDAIVPTDYVLDRLLKYSLVSFKNYNEAIGKSINLLGEQFVISDYIITDYAKHNEDFDYPQKLVAYNTTKMNNYTFNKYNLLTKYKREMNHGEGIRLSAIDCLSSEFIKNKACDYGTTQLENDNEIIITKEAYCLFANINYQEMEWQELYELMESKVGTYIHIDLKDERNSSMIVDSDYLVKGVICTEYFNSVYSIYFEKNHMDNFEYQPPLIKPLTYAIEWGNSYDSTNLTRFLRNHDYYILSDVSSTIESDVGYVTSTAIFFNILSVFFSILLIATLLFFNANVIKHNKRNIGIAHSLGINHKEITVMLLIENAFDVCVALVASLLTGAVFTAMTNYLAINKGFANYSLFYFNPLIHLAVFGITLIISFLLTVFIHSRVKKIEVSNLLKS